MNRYSTGRRSKTSDLNAAARLSVLRAAGVPALISAHEAWFLSGGVRGSRFGTEMVPMAMIAKEVPDAEHFLNDWREVSQ